MMVRASALTLAVMLGCGSTASAPDETASYVSGVDERSSTYAQLDAELFSGWTREFTRPESSDHGYWADVWRSFYQGPRVWGQVNLPKDIAQAVGDAQVYLMSGGIEMHRLIGVRQGRFYDLPEEINDFLVDGGLLPSPKNVAQIVRVYTFFMIAFVHTNYRGPDFMDGRWIRAAPRIDSIQRAIIPLVPSYNTKVLDVEFVKSGWPPRPGYILRLHALLTWQGRHTTMAIEFEESAAYPHRSFPSAWDMGNELVPDGSSRDVLPGYGFPLQPPLPKQMRGD